MIYNNDPYRPAFTYPYEWRVVRDQYRPGEPIIIDGAPLTVEWYMRIVNLRWDAMIQEQMP